MKTTELNDFMAKELFSSIWLLTHGIAYTIAINQYSFDEQKTRKILINSFKGISSNCKGGITI
ncbi:MAG: hypothetical protein VB130_05220 [Clostridium sp.]|nr:hypothetical protein [Clostridium sp.]